MQKLCGFFILWFLALPAIADDDSLSIEELKSLDLGSLLDLTVETASGTEETLLDAPASMVVVTKQDIQQRGYTNIVEVLQDLPGFDNMIVNGMVYTSSYQRGYRTPFTTRTLFMINGVVDNTLWAHEAAFSRQYPLSNIKRIEVLYGPASAVYGPNAFLGVVNVITDNGADLEIGEITGSISGLIGSFNSKNIDATLKGKLAEELSFSISAQQFTSDEPNFSDRYGYLSNSLYDSEQIWGPIRNIQHEGEYLNHYYDPTKDYGVLADMTYKGLKIGLIHWKLKEAYGPYYPADRVQNNNFWNRDSNQYYAEYKTDLTDTLKSQSLILYRENRRYGYWTEGSPDDEHSYISFTNWNAETSSWLFKHSFEYELREDLLLSAGLKYERKELTKGYDIPGYWAPAISSTTEVGSGIGHSTDTSYDIPPPPGAMPEDNLTTTRDVGGYVQAIWDWEDWRFNLGLRYDRNSMYGSVINPRVAAIYNYNDKWTFKALYGKAFQEPAPLHLWGGWSGRAANPDLQPEKVQNIELIAMYNTDSLSQEWSLYSAHYTDVIKEEAENAGERDIWGLEYRAKLSFTHFIENFDDITAYFNYSYTHPESSVFYDHNTGDWLDVDAALGDIAPHKINLGINMPFADDWNVNVRGNFVSSRELYLRNPLRGQGEKLGSYFVLNSAISYQYEPLTVTFKVLNLLDKDYFHPGAEAANAGNDFSQRSLGYINSIVPQAERSYWLQMKFDF